MTTPRSRRPARTGRAERREQLLRAARDLFAAEGYHHVAVTDVCGRVGVAKPIAYRHFRSKLDLYLAVVDAEGASLVDEVRGALAPLADGAPVSATHTRALAALNAVVGAYHRYTVKAGPAASLLFESDVMRDSAVRARVLAPNERAAQELAYTLEGITGLPPESTLVIARTCTALARSAAGERHTPGTSHDDALLVPRIAWGGLQSMLVGPAAPAAAAAL
ncbi:DNA-binding transcriptional regulator, AcrR family [Paraoerskovia marina]|uniref:DNA-binding transcriptional regulator, AcrR family n=1 Tax=Paraoerskovia marina TaxID=545619 RepID=A0A1H1UXF4_9CELL|nr:TetR/AcrR family transcriptional regulator [Paraoerskovia marina]SDS76941.1 DNA-binding transcriptional regulator, AcrR family [Paraoerskovia marina]